MLVDNRGGIEREGLPQSHHQEAGRLGPHSVRNGTTFKERWSGYNGMQKTAVVAIGILGSPLIFVYMVGEKIPGMAKYACKKISQAAKFIFFTIPKAIYDYVLVPIGKGIKKAAVWVRDKILNPIGRGIKATAEFIFVTIPKAIYDYVLVPIGKGIKKAAVWVRDKILNPIGRGIKATAEFIFVTVPVEIYSSALAPAGRGP